MEKALKSRQKLHAKNENMTHLHFDSLVCSDAFLKLYAN